MLQIEHMSTGYGKKQVLFDVSLEVKQGNIVLLAGSNGSGKSTLLKAIYGMLPQWHNGKIAFDGEDITGKPTAALLAKGLLYIPQKNNLFEDLTVKENLEMAGLTLNRKTVQQRMGNVLSTFTSLTPHLHRTPMKLSGGERQLLVLAMAQLHQPKMILIDEPFTGLAPRNISLIIEHLKALNEDSGATLLIVEHRIKECARFVHELVGLKLGKIFSRSSVEGHIETGDLHLLFV